MKTTTAATATSTATTSRRSLSAKLVARIAMSTIVGVTVFASATTAASAEVDDFVQCIPTEFELCPGAEEPDPGDPTPFAGPGDLEDNSPDPDPCLEAGIGCPKPGDPTPFDGPGDLTTCGPHDDQPACPTDGGDGEEEAPSIGELIADSQWQGATGREGAIVRLYGATFRRLPDAPGLAFWVADERTTFEIANFFVTSDEFVATYGTLSDAEFVEAIYNNVLDRSPDAAGMDYWLGRLDADLSRAALVVFFSDGPEFRELTQTS